MRLKKSRAAKKMKKIPKSSGERTRFFGGDFRLAGFLVLPFF
jgi:hypothetical protein